LLVSPRAELAPAADDGGEWEVRDRGALRFRAPLDAYRVSVLWKADVYPNEDERARQCARALSLEDVARVFDADLAARREPLRFDLACLGDAGFAQAVAELYPEAAPLDALPSFFDPA
jgi:hypothetical protein